MTVIIISALTMGWLFAETSEPLSKAFMTVLLFIIIVVAAAADLDKYLKARKRRASVLNDIRKRYRKGCEEC